MSNLDDVFVSHSHRDEVRAKALVKKLENWGISVYVDFDDPHLSELPNSELAERLISKLRRCRLLIFAFSEDAVTSRWMPWELGLAHGVIGRAVLWPFTKKALRAAETQEYLHLYEALDPVTAQQRLEAILGSARAAAIRPSDLRQMEDMANVTIAKLPEFQNPAVATEFSIYGPAQLYSAWLDTFTKMWQPK